MVNDGDVVTIYNSIHRVMKVEKVLKGARVEMLLIPVPRQLSSDCGLAIRCPFDVWPELLAVLEEQGLAPSAAFRLKDSSYEAL